MALPGFKAALALGSRMNSRVVSGRMPNPPTARVEPAAYGGIWIAPLIDWSFWGRTWDHAGGPGGTTGDECRNPLAYMRCRTDCIDRICIHGDTAQMARCLDDCIDDCKKTYC